MLKRRIIKRILVSTGALFALLLIYLMPTKVDEPILPSSTLPSNIEKAYIYLLDDNNMLGRTSVIINNKELIPKAEELIEILISGGKGESSIPNGFRSFLPGDTIINGITYDNKTLNVDFTVDILNISSDLEMPMIESLVYTLTEIDGVDNIVITINGNNLNKLPNTNMFIPTYLNRKIGINKVYNITSLDNVSSITEYYINTYNDNTYYVPVTKYVNDDRERIKVIIEDLTSSNMYMTDLMSYINSNTKLLEANVVDNKMELVFNSYIFNDYDKKDILEEVIDTISLSVNDNYDVDEVVFYVDKEEICKSVLKTIE